MSTGARASANAVNAKTPFKLPSRKELKAEAEEDAKAKAADAKAKAAAKAAKAAIKKAAAAKAKALKKAKADAVKEAMNKVKASSSLVNQFAGVYHVYYRGGKRGTDMQISCDGQVEQKNIFKDRLHFTNVKAKCNQKRD